MEQRSKRFITENFRIIIAQCMFVSTYYLYKMKLKRVRDISQSYKIQFESVLYKEESNCQCLLTIFNGP